MLKRLKRVIIKEEFVAITGDIMEAIILNQFIYWSERVSDFDQFIMEENERQKKSCIPSEGDKPVEYPLLCGWIYKSAAELKDEIMSTESERTIRRKIDNLVEKGFLDRRNNPNLKYDRTYQYRVNFFNIIKALEAFGYSLEGYKVNIKELYDDTVNTIGQNVKCIGQDEEDTNGQIVKCIGQNDRCSNVRCIGQNVTSNGHNVRAIPEITSENIYNTYNDTSYSYKSVSQSINNKTSDMIDGMKGSSGKVTSISENEIMEFRNFISLCELDKLQKKYIEYKNAVQSALMDLYFADSMTINKKYIPGSAIRSQMEKLNILMIEHALDNFVQASRETQIKYPKAYLKACLFNAVDEMDINVQTRVNYDMAAMQDSYIVPEENNDEDASGSSAEEPKIVPLLERYSGTEFEGPITRLKEMMGEGPAYDTFIDTILNVEREGNIIRFTVESPFYKNILENRYEKTLFDAFKTIGINQLEIETGINNSAEGR